MKLIAHRGLYRNKDEQNTMIAFFDAVNNNDYIGFECDVRETKDKKYIINHDAFLDDQLIKFTNFKDLKTSNIVTLSDVLNINTNKIILLEIKDIHIDVNKFNKILKKYKDKNIYVMSFHNNIINKLHESPHNYKIGLLNYVLNNEEEFNYDFVGLLNNLTDKEEIDSYLNNEKEVFIYGMLKVRKYIHGEECYYIVD